MTNSSENLADSLSSRMFATQHMEKNKPRLYDFEYKFILDLCPPCHYNTHIGKCIPPLYIGFRAIESVIPHVGVTIHYHYMDNCDYHDLQQYRDTRRTSTNAGRQLTET